MILMFCLLGKSMGRRFLCQVTIVYVFYRVMAEAKATPEHACISRCMHVHLCRH